MPAEVLVSRKLKTMQARRSAVFLDRDGVLNIDKGYVYRIQDLELIEGAGTAIKKLNDLRYLIIVITNQSGIGRGIYSELDMYLFNRELCLELAKCGARIDAIYFCPYHPDAVISHYKMDHEDRKPRPGMIIRAIADFSIDIQSSFLIGDKDTDLKAAEAAGIRGYLFDSVNLDLFVSNILNERVR